MKKDKEFQNMLTLKSEEKKSVVSRIEQYTNCKLILEI